MLENVFDGPAIVEDRNLGRAPDMRIHAARGIGNIVFYMRDFVGLTRLEHPVEGGLELLAALTFVRECIEFMAADDVVALAIHELEIGLVCPSYIQLVIEQQIGVRRVREHELEVDSPIQRR